MDSTSVSQGVGAVTSILNAVDGGADLVVVLAIIGFAWYFIYMKFFNGSQKQVDKANGKEFMGPNDTRRMIAAEQVTCQTAMKERFDDGKERMKSIEHQMQENKEEITGEIHKIGLKMERVLTTLDLMKER